MATFLTLLFGNLNFQLLNCEFIYIFQFINREATTKIPDHIPSDVHWVFRISFMYYAFIGLILTCLVAYPISLLTGGTEDLDEILLTPLVRSKKYTDKLNKIRDDVKYAELDQSLKVLKTTVECDE